MLQMKRAPEAVSSEVHVDFGDCVVGKLRPLLPGIAKDLPPNAQEVFTLFDPGCSILSFLCSRFCTEESGLSSGHPE